MISKERVRDLGEVYTNKREVVDMLDIIYPETFRISSRFLEPSCGNGNFIEEILSRKLETVIKYSKRQKQFEFNIIKSVSSIYGIDICKDNVEATKNRVVLQIESLYSMERNTNMPTEGFYESIKYVLNKNIIKADAINEINKISFSEFTSPKNISNIKIIERVYSYKDILEGVKKPKKEFPPTFYNKIYLNT